jgi:hypothetical protein
MTAQAGVNIMLEITMPDFASAYRSHSALLDIIAC